MLGHRLETANAIARRRAARWGNDIPYYRFRKWNQTCSCWACRKPRYSRHSAKTRQDFKSYLWTGQCKKQIALRHYEEESL